MFGKTHSLPSVVPPPTKQYVWLGDMILLGDTLRTRLPADWCGCALGGALMAMGHEVTHKTPDVVYLCNEMFPWLRDIKPSLGERRDSLAFAFYFEEWGAGVSVISALFYNVCDGKMTIEALADMVNRWQAKYDPKAPKRTVVAKVKGVMAEQAKHARKKTAKAKELLAV